MRQTEVRVDRGSATLLQSLLKENRRLCLCAARPMIHNFLLAIKSDEGENH